MTGDLLLAIDQGTTSTRALAFDRDLSVVAASARPIRPEHPMPGWVEIDPTALLASVVETVAEVLDQVDGPGRIRAAGIANQGETVVAWDAATLEPLAPAIVWQCRRSEGIIERLRRSGVEAMVRRISGLPLDPYFSAGKMTWLLEQSVSVGAAATAGRLRLGTVEAWLTAHLGDGGPDGRTDPSTASRTQLFDLGSLAWSEELLGLFGVVRDLLPRLGPTAGPLGSIGHPGWGGRMALTAMACDQAAALYGHRWRENPLIPTMKATYGTGVFVAADAGHRPVIAEGLETSVGWSMGHEPPTYILQGGVLSAGSFVDWLHESLGLIVDLAHTSVLASSVSDAAGVKVLPALTGLGAPWYRPAVRGTVTGLTSGTRPAHIVRAALDAIAQRVADVVEAMMRVLPVVPSVLRVDGGATMNHYLMQRQADLIGLPVEVAEERETTAVGTALLAARGAGLDVGQSPGRSIGRMVFEPRLTSERRTAEREGWRAFVTAASAL